MRYRILQFGHQIYLIYFKTSTDISCYYLINMYSLNNMAFENHGKYMYMLLCSQRVNEQTNDHLSYFILCIIAFFYSDFIDEELNLLRLTITKCT